jgi:hypothetical protein
VKYLKNPLKIGMCENPQKLAYYFASVCYTILPGNITTYGFYVAFDRSNAYGPHKE